MIHNGTFKLIYQPNGNAKQLFNIAEDPGEMKDLSQLNEYQPMLLALEQRLMKELYGDDTAWVQNGQLVGLPRTTIRTQVGRGLQGQRGPQFPAPPSQPFQPVI